MLVSYYVYSHLVSLIIIIIIISLVNAKRSAVFCAASFLRPARCHSRKIKLGPALPSRLKMSPSRLQPTLIAISLWGVVLGESGWDA